MATAVHIRAAQKVDAGAIAAIWNPVIATTAITFTTATKTPEALAQDIARKGPAFQVACVDGRVVGFATYGPFRNGPGYAYTREHTIVLAPQAQGFGVGRALMQAIETAAMAEGIHSLWAGVSGENPAGVRFHA
ncbi:MAG: GNAT family N-acetyltransferase, partial [Paracoccaceae bacterium]